MLIGLVTASLLLVAVGCSSNDSSSDAGPGLSIAQACERADHILGDQSLDDAASARRYQRLARNTDDADLARAFHRIADAYRDHDDRIPLDDLFIFCGG
jgi:hypothetical protein